MSEKNGEVMRLTNADCLTLRYGARSALRKRTPQQYWDGGVPVQWLSIWEYQRQPFSVSGQNDEVGNTGVAGRPLPGQGGLPDGIPSDRTGASTHRAEITGPLAPAIFRGRELAAKADLDPTLQDGRPRRLMNLKFRSIEAISLRETGKFRIFVQDPYRRVRARCRNRIAASAARRSYQAPHRYASNMLRMRLIIPMRRRTPSPSPNRRGGEENRHNLRAPQGAADPFWVRPKPLQLGQPNLRGCTRPRLLHERKHRLYSLVCA
jgi:hypothetical protein